MSAESTPPRQPSHRPSPPITAYLTACVGQHVASRRLVRIELPAMPAMVHHGIRLASTSYGLRYEQGRNQALTCVRIYLHQPSMLPGAAALDAELTAFAPGPPWCRAKLARPSLQPLLAADMLCLDTTGLDQNCSERSKFAQRPLQCQQLHCSQKNPKVFTSFCCSVTGCQFAFLISCAYRVLYTPFLDHHHQLCLAYIRRSLRCLLQMISQLS